MYSISIIEYSNTPVVSEWKINGIVQLFPDKKHPSQSHAPELRALFNTEEKFKVLSGE
jgi:hypothetical protein